MTVLSLHDILLQRDVFNFSIVFNDRGTITLSDHKRHQDPGHKHDKDMIKDRFSGETGSVYRSDSRH